MKLFGSQIRISDRQVRNDTYLRGGSKMDISGIGAAGYPAWRGTEKAQQSTTGKRFADQVNHAAGSPKVHQIYMEEDMLWSGGNGTGLSYYLKYAENSTEDDPIVIAKGVDENGDEFEQTIHINKVNPKCATVVEMRALEAHTGVKKLGGFTSLPLETGAMGLNDRTDFMDLFQNQINDMKQLSQKRAVAYYQYSMKAYWDFMNRK